MCSLAERCTSFVRAVQKYKKVQIDFYVGGIMKHIETDINIRVYIEH